MDQFDTFGLGEDVPIATGNGSDSLLALVDGKFVILRVPYPLGFYAKGLDGRIDDPRGRLEGERAVVDLCHPGSLSQRRGTGNHQQGSPLPASARSAGQVIWISLFG